jgi:PIN domain nuclease of toxin-antitoxin system
MNFFIDTHVLIWYLENNKRLNSKHTKIINEPTNQPFVSSVCLWEIAIKTSLGKLGLSIPFSELELFLVNHNFTIQNFDFVYLSICRFVYLSILKTLPFHHSDPFDRLIISQSISKNIPLMAYDDKLASHKKQGLQLL